MYGVSKKVWTTSWPNRGYRHTHDLRIKNCLLVHGIEEKEGEQTDKVIIDTVVEKMNIAITSDDLDRSNRIGKKKVISQDRS